MNRLIGFKIIQIKKEKRDMWIKFEVEIQIRNRIIGGIPKNPEMIKAWLESRGLGDLEEKTKAELADQLTEGQWQGFKKDDNGLYVEARQVKAMLKEAANIVRHVIKFKGPMRARLAERLFITPDHISLRVKQPTGSRVKECTLPSGTFSFLADIPTGSVEKPIHVMTRLGPRTALKRSDYVQAPRLEFALWLLDDGMFDGREHLLPLFNYAGEAGLGADRSQGEGQFDLLNLEEMGEYEMIDAG